MKKEYKAAQLGFGQLGEPWFHYVTRQEQWGIDLFKKVEDFNAEEFDCVFLAVNDQSLPGLVERLSPSKTSIFHFSGSQSFNTAIGMHPVYSFSKHRSKVNFGGLNWVLDSKKIPFNVKSLLGESTHYLDPDLKKSYHSYLSIAANMSQLLSFMMAQSFHEKTNLPQDLLKDLMIQSLKNEKKMGPQSFSGPWVRNEKHIQDKTIEDLKDNFLSKNNENFNELIEVYNEHYRV